MARRLSILIRYGLIIFLSAFYYLFYPLLSFLTVYASYLSLSLFYPASLEGNTLIFSGKSIEIIDACISGLAYLLLTVLNLAVDMPLIKRLKSLLFSYVLLFTFNILRIILLSSLFLSEFQYFDALHLFFWYAGSILAVFIIWILTIRIFKIKKIPVADDVGYLLGLMKKKR